jgi:hypothetical protein
MAWTAPRTWTDGELVTKAIMDPHVRDNFLAVGPHLIARKTADQSVTSSTVMVNDNHLALTVAANEVWLCQFFLLYQAGTTGDIKIGFTYPTAGEIAFDTAWPAAGGTIAEQTWYDTSSPTPEVSGFGDGANRHVWPIFGVYTNGANAGTLQLTFAQQTSDGTASTLKANSSFWAVKLA